EDDLRLVNQGQRDEQALLLAAGERHEPGVALGLEAELGEQRVGVGGAGVERLPEVHGLPDLDPFLELRLLVLDADALAEGVAVAPRVEAKDRDRALVRPAM